LSRREVVASLRRRLVERPAVERIILPASPAPTRANATPPATAAAFSYGTPARASAVLATSHTRNDFFADRVELMSSRVRDDQNRCRRDRVLERDSRSA
jgi:hypothetical protein